MLTRSFMEPSESKKLLAYSPMLHSRLFRGSAKFRDSHFHPTKASLVSHIPDCNTHWLDGNPKFDRPLIVQFCANDPEDLLDAAKYVAPYCDAVDLNLGCPQGIARTGRYGAFLQEDWDLIYKLINKLHKELPIPVTAKFRILESKERTLEYARMILSAGASILTVHGRRREQKGHSMGIADWSYIEYLREHLPPDTVIFANGNVLNREDLQPCLDATGADGVMSAEANLSDPTIFAYPPSTETAMREYWRGHPRQEGYRVDAVIRRYFDIIYHYVLEKPPPERRPLFIPSDSLGVSDRRYEEESNNAALEPPKKRRKRDRKTQVASPSLKSMQGHLFQLLRPMLSTHTDIRDTLSKCGVGDMSGFERILTMIESAVKEALLHEARRDSESACLVETGNSNSFTEKNSDTAPTIASCKRPWWVCQPYIRPLPEEARESGALTASKKETARMSNSMEQDVAGSHSTGVPKETGIDVPQSELPKEGLVCG